MNKCWFTISGLPTVVKQVYPEENSTMNKLKSKADPVHFLKMESLIKI